ncbi:MAG: hemolysin family protein [Deltaproteobacteria bacterium]|jgi:putative hemolysin|nr:hemolysin family protein [Deltaproteobacteria bacterium]
MWLKFSKLFKKQPSNSLVLSDKLSEFAQLVSAKEHSGDFDKEDERMLKGVIGLSNTVAREIMTPRTDLVTVQFKDELATVCAIVTENNFSRYPVIDQNVDNVVGILLAKDLLPYLSVQNVTRSPEEFSVAKVMRKPYFITQNKPVDDLLSEFKTQKLHIAIILDEHGGVDGIVTLEDLIEEIVGDIFDESDELEEKIVEKDGKVIVGGGVLVCDLNTEYKFGIPEDKNYDTIAGFLYNALGRVPADGDFVDIKNSETNKDYRISVKSIDDFRIKAIEIFEIN